MSSAYLGTQVADQDLAADCQTTTSDNWSNVLQYALDQGGPVLRPFQRLGVDFTNIAAFDHLRNVVRQYPDKLAINDGDKGRQVEINGRHVEPAELERLLRCAPSVADAVAIVTAANELVAFTVSRRSAEATFSDELRDPVVESHLSANRPLIEKAVAKTYSPIESRKLEYKPST
ncbi:hypothetical protein [Mesorhizobium sp. M0166]|uniref:hypothetical protein n=1 Tax=Mesorhizobium sp. M0166 TaxID=2956902 RepID=UPI003339AB94